MKILIIGHARHGKDTFAEMLTQQYDFKFESSSEAAVRIFLFDTLKDKYGYTTEKECFEDRINHRAEWYNLICEYNSQDKARLAKQILIESDMYVGMRDLEEILECKKQSVFDIIIGVYDYRKPLEPSDSFNINIFEHSDIIICNSGTLEDLRNKITLLKI